MGATAQILRKSLLSASSGGHGRGANTEGSVETWAKLGGVAGCAARTSCLGDDHHRFARGVYQFPAR